MKEFLRNFKLDSGDFAAVVILGLILIASIMYANRVPCSDCGVSTLSGICNECLERRR